MYNFITATKLRSRCSDHVRQQITGRMALKNKLEAKCQSSSCLTDIGKIKENKPIDDSSVVFHYVFAF